MSIPFEDYVPDVAVVVSGCPELAIKNALRSSAVEFAEKSEVSRLTKTLTIDAGVNTLTIPQGSSYIHKVLWATFEGKEIEPVTEALLNDRVPGWRVDGETGDPKYYFTTGVSPVEITVWPAPEETSAQGLKVHVVTKPGLASDIGSEDALGPFKDAIVNGAIQRLFRIPNKAWSDLKAASVYQTLFLKGCEEAKLQSKPDRPIARRVNYGGLKQSTRFRNRGWRKGY